MHPDVRLTNATLDVLGVVAAADGSPVYGFQISTLTGRPTGTVYPLLSRLERVGWLEGAWESEHHRGNGPRRRYYKVTSQGREHIAVALRRRERPAPVRAFRPVEGEQSNQEAGAPVSVEEVAREFARGLRRLRADAGDPSLRQLSARTFYSPAALSEAFSGRSIPSEKLLEVLVRACGETRRSGRCAGRPPSRASATARASPSVSRTSTRSGHAGSATPCVNMNWNPRTSRT